MKDKMGMWLNGGNIKVGRFGIPNFQFTTLFFNVKVFIFITFSPIFLLRVVPS